MIRNFRRGAATIAALFISAAASTASAQVIDLPDGSGFIAPFGKSNSATVGQTFTVDASFNYLQSFSFWLSNDEPGTGAVNPAALKFQAYVMQWDGTNGRAMGPVLYSSSIQSGPTAFSQRYDFGGINTFLTGGGQYVAFLSASGLFSTIGAGEASAAVETSFGGGYTGGQLVYTDNGDDFSALSTETWTLAGDFPDAQTRFNAQFTAEAVAVVPEPSSLLLMVVGLSVLMFVVMKKKRV